MTVLDQPIHTYLDTTPHKRSVSELIQMITPRDTPVLARIGLNSAMSKFQIREHATKIELLEDELHALETTANQGTTITSTTLSITVADGTFFQDGHMIEIGTEIMVVSVVAAQVLTIEARGLGNSTKTTHAATAAIKIVGMARLEGDDADYGPVIDITAPYNYTTIFQRAVKVTGTQQAISQYGIADTFRYQSNKSVPHLLVLMERGFFKSERAVGAATTRRSMGGIGTFVSTNSASITTTITKAAVDSLAETVHLASGVFPDMLVLHPTAANNLRNLIDSSSFVREDQDNAVFGMMEIESVRTQYGNLELVMDRHCHLNKAWMLNRDKVGGHFLKGRTLDSKMLSITGDSTKGETVGEWTFLAANEKAHGYITTSAANL